VYDLIGNVWEWTRDDAVSGTYNGRPLPQSGYVAQVDQSGIAVISTSSPDHMFADDYLWTSDEGSFGMLRGGFYASKSDAGVFALHAETLPTAPGAGIGFRCVQ
jgi:formylglycine-generating enzyme required for sulfatase activity